MGLARLTSFLTLAVAAGCLPIPHTSERFPAMRGRVVDSATGQPVAGAVIAIHDHPSTVAKTDAGGVFHLSRQVNFHWAVIPGPCPTDWPAGTDWSELLDITHPDYESLEVDAGNQVIPSYDDDYDAPEALRDIGLTPRRR